MVMFFGENHTPGAPAPRVLRVSTLTTASEKTLSSAMAMTWAVRPGLGLGTLAMPLAALTRSRHERHERDASALSDATDADPGTAENTNETCSDAVDNDSDGQVDCDSTAVGLACQEEHAHICQVTTKSAINNGIWVLQEDIEQIWNQR